MANSSDPGIAAIQFEVGLSNEEIRKVLASHPRLLTLNIDEKMQPIAARR